MLFLRSPLWSLALEKRADLEKSLGVVGRRSLCLWAGAPEVVCRRHGLWSPPPAAAYGLLWFSPGDRGSRVSRVSEGVRSARVGQKREEEPLGNQSSEFLESEPDDSLKGEGLGWWGGDS